MPGILKRVVPLQQGFDLLSAAHPVPRDLGGVVPILDIENGDEDREEDGTVAAAPSARALLVASQPREPAGGSTRGGRPQRSGLEFADPALGSRRLRGH